MRAWWAVLGGLPAVARWSVVGVASLLVAVVIAAGAWTVLERREASARRAFAAASAPYHQALAGREDSRLAAAVNTLTQFLNDYSRSAAAPQAWYFLGNLEYARRGYDPALKAFGEGVRRGTGMVAALSRLGLAYSWEAKGESARALEAYRDALQGREAKDFLYPDFLLGMARVQEQLQQPAAAIETYRRFLRDVPDAAQAGEVRGRLALLGATA